jgi:O-antigen/teichoic acid export membrane protein
MISRQASKLIRDISASSAQVLFNQVAGAVIFLVTSAWLSKETYGEFNWSLAILTFTTAILSLRLDQIIVRKVAAGADASKLLTLFTGHIVISGLLFYGGLLAAYFLFPEFFKQHNILLILGISHLLSFFSAPFKQVANGKEDFRLLAWMSSIANIIRVCWLLITVATTLLTIRQLLLIYIVSSFIELIFCLVMTRSRLNARISLQYPMKEYLVLIRESLPQAAGVFLNASIARIDWILLGLFSGPVITAEYSFAYRAFELSPLPLLIIAPVLLSRFSRFFGRYGASTLLERKKELSFLVRMEMVAATFIPLVLNIVWSPLIDGLTYNKYGAVNKTSFLLLSLCIPFLYLNNLLWSVHFAQNHLKLILRITFVTFSIILAGNLFFIPLYNAQGAAAVYLAAIVVEYINYMRFSFISRFKETWLSPLVCMSVAVICGVLACYITPSLSIRLLTGILLYFMLLLATKQLKKSDIKQVVKLFRSSK